MRIWGTGKQVLTEADLLRRDAAVLWFVQGDAAANGEDDGVLCGGGGAQSGRESREEEEAGKGENEERLVMPIYKEGLMSGHKN